MGSDLDLPAGTGAPERVDAVLRAAVRLGASDVHLEPAADGTRVRLRRDGALEEAARWPRDAHEPVIARLKVLAGLLTYRTDVPQEGRIPGDGLDLRLSVFPTLFGEKAVVRIFDPRRAVFDLDRLGFADAIRAELDRWSRLPSGLLLLTGPTGAGKTTTIYALLRRLVERGGGRNIVTVEDPVEHAIAGVTQTQINPHAGLDFATALRSLLRQDPDVMVVGEVRDRETARIAAQAALTGRLVVTTLHAGRASGAFARLLNLGVEPAELASSVSGVLAQRLVRAAQGGRTPIAEALKPGPATRRAVLARADEADLEAAARADGLAPLADAARALVREGRVTEADVERVLGPVEDLRK